MRGRGVLLLVLIGAGVVCYFAWFRPSNSGSTGNTDLPPVAVDEATLTQRGMRKLADIRARVQALQEAGVQARFDGARDIADGLRSLGAYESATAWYLKTWEWYDALPPARQADRGCQFTLGASAISACHTLFLMGDQKQAVGALTRFMRKYPRNLLSDSIRDTYELARDDPEGYLRDVASVFSKSSKYVKR